MDFEPFDYMAWAKAWQGQLAYDLSASGMPPPDAEVFAPGADCLTLAGVSPALRAELRAAIARMHGVTPAQVLPASGASEANFLACALILQAGDSVLVEQPAYQVLARLPGLFGARTLRFLRSEARNWAWDWDDLERAWRPGTRLLILTSPHNPTGVADDARRLQRLGEWLQARNAWGLIDQVYRDFDPAPPPVAQRLHPRLVTTASLTKVHGLSALRAGWLIGPPELIRRGEQLYDFMAVNPPTGTLLATLQAIHARHALAERARQRASANRQLLADFLRVTPELSGSVPDHGIIALLKLPAGCDDSAFAEQLARTRQTLVTPGTFFDVPGHIRLGLGGTTSMVEAGLARLAEGVRAIAPNAGNRP